MKERAIATQAETLEWHKKRWGQRDINPLLPSLSCPAFAATAVMEDGHSEGMITKESFIEDYVLLLFMPMEGNVDKAELEAFSAELDHLAHLGCQVVAISGDSVVAIRQWSISAKTGFPIISDKSLDLAKAFGVKRRSGMMTRATFLLNKERKVCFSASYPRCVARNPKEMVRQVAAARELDSIEEGGELPADWHPGEETLPFNLEDKKIFLGVDDNQLDMRRDATMGEPKVLDVIGLFNHVMRDIGGPRDLSFFFQGI